VKQQKSEVLGGDFHLMSSLVSDLDFHLKNSSVSCDGHGRPDGISIGPQMFMSNR
jgi:hypothetical protein